MILKSKPMVFYDPALRVFCGFMPKRECRPHNPEGPDPRDLCRKFFGCDVEELTREERGYE